MVTTNVVSEFRIAKPLACQSVAAVFSVLNHYMSCFELKSSFEQRIRVVLSGFGWFFQVSEFFRTEKFFQIMDSGLSLRIRGVLSSFGVLQNSKVLSNNGFGSFSPDSGCSFKILMVLQKFFQMDVDAFFDG